MSGQAETAFNGVVKVTGSTDACARHKRGVFRSKEGRLELGLTDYTAFRK
jgi:hypothetical protein